MTHPERFSSSAANRTEPLKKPPSSRKKTLSTQQPIYRAPTRQQSQDEPTASVLVTAHSRLRRRPKVYLTAPSTVPWVDLQRFSGRWYEIARIPYFTQRRCVGNVISDYHLTHDGLLHVDNYCLRKNGQTGQTRGLARVVDPATNARLQISFRALYGVHVFWDDYWIIGLGSAYDYALIGEPTRQRGWILARTAHPESAQISDWLAEFGAKGFLVNAFIRTPHTEQGS
jgi:apolipoprotein D and lipocalin family protein